MAEAVGLAASIIAVVSLAAQLASRAKIYAEEVDQATTDLERIIAEISTLEPILKSLENTLASTTDAACRNELQRLAHQAIKGCRGALQYLITLIPEPGVARRSNEEPSEPPQRRRRLKDLAKMLSWPSRKMKADGTMLELGRYKATITIILSMESSSILNTIQRRLDSLETLQMSSDKPLLHCDRPEFSNWLVPGAAEYSEVHVSARERHESDTGDWVFQCPQWKSWIDTQSCPSTSSSPSRRCLWVTGIPGAGKTILASHMYAKLASQTRKQPSACSVAYYCRHSHNRDETRNFLRWVVYQLCLEARIDPPILLELYLKQHQPSTDDLLDELGCLVASIGHIFVVLDAVDESKPRDKLLETLYCLGTDARFENLKMVVTSRKYRDIEDTMCLIAMELPMLNDHVTSDIRIYVEQFFRRSPHKFKYQSTEFIQHVIDVLPIKAEGMFRLAELQLSILQKRQHKGETVLRKLFEQLPRGIFDAYRMILDLLAEETGGSDSDDCVTVRDCLSWILHCSLLFERSAQPALPTEVLIRVTNAESFHDLRELLGCLVRFTRLMFWEPDSDYEPRSSLKYDAVGVEFAHYTVREYLTSQHPDPRERVPDPFSPLSWPQFAEILLLQALSCEKVDFLAKGQQRNDQLATEFLLSGAFLALRSWKTRLGPREKYSENASRLIIRLGQPNEPHFSSLRSILQIQDLSIGPGLELELYPHYALWDGKDITTYPPFEYWDDLSPASNGIPKPRGIPYGILNMDLPEIVHDVLNE